MPIIAGFTTEQLLRYALMELDSLPSNIYNPLYINEKPLPEIIRDHLAMKDIFYDTEGRN